ncbi:MAG: hypothetical protein KZQ58_03765 [gamma proteobacterium symbiont of Bathyaustriella thionipta]|nr:hypothetical protein [gamma proteobacterium symbiont of Bathyaustriella thionipta]
MSEDKLLTRLSEYFNLSAKRRRKKVEELEKVIRKIKKKEKEMIANCRKVHADKEREILKHRYRILHAQRKKGQKALHKIKNG